MFFHFYPRFFSALNFQPLILGLSLYMTQICSYVTTGICEKRKCEVNLFLNDFINRVYNTDLRDIGFECLDISGADGKRPEISFVFGGQKTVIEAKTLVNPEINITISFTGSVKKFV
ncbi:hypothetical protein M2444_004814 [Paenibacillus sp. PastF-3]|nr:hypothetical protein [Paenibacillus sp. PastF-3]